MEVLDSETLVMVQVPYWIGGEVKSVHGSMRSLPKPPLVPLRTHWQPSLITLFPRPIEAGAGTPTWETDQPKRKNLQILTV